MVRGKWFPQGSDLSVPLALRQAVLSQGRDALDDMAQQVVVYDADMPVGTGHLWWAEGAFHLSGVGVLESARGKGFGDLLVRLILFKAQAHHANRVELVAPASVAPFFARYGFVTEDSDCADDERLGGSIRMTIRGEDIVLSHCSGGAKDCMDANQESR